MQDIWEFKDPQYPVYPTEKNLAMIKLIVEASSEKGDLVMDCFCGSGTTLVAAQSLGRHWIGIDSSSSAIRVTQQRLAEVPTSLFESVSYEYAVQDTVRSSTSPLTESGIHA